MTPTGVDAVWLMGVWQRSRVGANLALSSDDQMASFRTALPDLVDADVIGSAYSSGATGRRPLRGRAGLAAARAALGRTRRAADRRLRPQPRRSRPPVAGQAPGVLHPRNRRRPGQRAGGILEVGKAVIAHGRDPYFPPWPDVAQLNAFAPGLRRAAAKTLIDIAAQADGVRCDMAMLMLNDVFAQTWGDRAGAAPEQEYWSEVIAAVRAAHPDFVLIAEAYWDLEWRLQQLGFDFCYDKRLYDRLLHEDASSVRGHLRADLDYQHRLVRFLENHDEPRVAAELSPERERAAAVAVATLPGATLWHEGQFEGWRVRLPVFLRRRPDESVDEELRAFYLLLIAAAATIRRGDWALCEATGWPDDHSYDQLLAWSWTDDDHRALVVINDADAPASARIQLPWDDLAGQTWLLDDVLAGVQYERDGTELDAEGLYVELAPWQFHVSGTSAQR